MYRYRLLSAGLVLLTAALLAAGASAQIYKWVDDQGNVHFGDKPRDKAQAEQAAQA